ncbi:sensor histidine kinase [Shewanella sp. D64]|uniref:sensor histidine kinase n=1 Tax=unclassified Shewanella TaxID=196818 RepID=UPI0022BA1F07|nr:MULTISPECIES: HAMP domain-containing sensor histidine kinase [unclassified Shewanella]MEC4726098.1 sensor histidine kinase [Shewanella sp. D64]MEC4737986.1 sensor histidine kinase [Shewanella sp. E94]WBJ96185.1 sensor histidine kinase [Shewanella sp. MTB7]
MLKGVFPQGFPNLNASDQLVALRTLGLALKLVLTFLVAETFGLSVDSPAIKYALMLETLYLAVTFSVRKPLQLTDSGLFIALLLDTVFWITWLYFTGGATNAFISLLLLPIAIAAVILPRWAPWTLTFISTLAYSLMLYSVPSEQMQHHGMDMGSHYLGMWLNFVISSLVLTTSVAFIAKRMRRQDAELAYMREAQLRQEKLLALGTASAQMAHQLATPLSSLRLLVEEVAEESDVNAPAVKEMNVALSRCEKTLADLRLATESIREQKKFEIDARELLHQLEQQVSLFMPQVLLEIASDPEIQYSSVQTDTSLLPAILSLIENAAHASSEHMGLQKVNIELDVDNELACLRLRVRDYGNGIPSGLVMQLGHKLVDSPTGMGVALMLSHASFERLGGQLILGAHLEGGTVAEVTLPLNGTL